MLLIFYMILHYGIKRKRVYDMVKIFNTLFFILKYILFIICFGFTFFIVLSMYHRIGKSMISSIYIFVPYVLLIIFYTINFSYRQEIITKNIFYNVTSCLVFSTIGFVCYRTLFDQGMVLNKLMGYNINFSYFSDFLPFMQILIYGLCISNLLLILGQKKEKPIARKVDVL